MQIIIISWGKNPTKQHISCTIRAENQPLVQTFCNNFPLKLKYHSRKGSSILKSKDIISKFNDWTIGLATSDLSSIVRIYFQDLKMIWLICLENEVPVMAIVSLQSGLCDTLSTIGKSLKKRGTIKKALQKAGLFTECQEDIEAIKTEIKKYITTTLASCSASRRRKRNTGKKRRISLICFSQTYHQRFQRLIAMYLFQPQSRVLR